MSLGLRFVRAVGRDRAGFDFLSPGETCDGSNDEI